MKQDVEILDEKGVISYKVEKADYLPCLKKTERIVI